MTALHFQIDAAAPASRLASVTLELPREAFGPEGELFLATWTPGSYLLREYSRQLSRVTAADADSGIELPCAKTAKNRFAVQVRDDTRRIRVAYRVYAHELTVRTADFTDDHAYWNNACMLLWPVGRRELPCTLQVAMPVGWDAASSLEVVDRQAGEITWRASDLDEAIDSPCLLGRFDRVEFTAAGVPHVAVLDGLDGLEPSASFAADLTAIIEAAAEVFGGALPYSNYQFLCLFTDDGYGGLEHRSSCTLLSKRTVFTGAKAYREFLALCAHELFHVWNVKRLRPVELWECDYERENYTQFLWLAEGWTAYYDDLLCLRAGRCTDKQYLEQVVTKNIERVLGGAGRHKLSLAESSHDAWIRLYRPDENTRNSSQNYYVNGAVAAMCLDLTIRRDSAGAACLDTVLQELWKQTFAEGRGYAMEDVVAAIRSVGGDAAVELVQTLVHGPLDPPLRELLADFGITFAIDRLDRPYLGVAFKPDSTRIASVQDGTAAADGGLHPDDEIVALRGLRVTSDNWREVFDAVAHIDEPIALLIARRGVIKTMQVTPRGNPTSVVLAVDPKAEAQAVKLRTGWLHSRP